MRSSGPRARAMIGLLALAVGACASPPRAASPPDPMDVERFELQAATREAARVVYVEGVFLRETGDGRGALDHFLDAVRLDPGEPMLRLALTRQYLQLGAVQEATTLLDGFEARYDLSAEEHLLAARLHVVAGRDSSAYRNLDAALREDPRMVLAWLLRGRMLLDDGKLDEALASLKRAEELDPYGAATQLRLADCYAQKGQRREAEAAYVKAIQFNPDMQAARTALATMYREDGRVDDAIRVYEEALSQEPTDAATLATLLELLLDSRRYEDAAHLLEPRFEAGILDPRQQYIYGWLLLQLGELDAAETVLAPLSELPAARGVDTLLGELALRRRSLDAARAHFEAAVRKQPDDCAAYISLAGVMIQELRGADGRLDRTASLDGVRDILATAAKATAADELRCNVMLGIAYSQLRDFEPAVHHLEAGYALDPGDPDVLFNLAMAHQELGHFDTALRYGRDALTLAPENPAALNFVGYLLAERGIELEDSENLIRRALRSEPDNGYYVDSLGWVFYQRGLYEQAALELERAVALTENRDPIILEHLGDTYVKMGRLDGAYQVYEQSRDLQPDSASVLNKIRDLQKRLGKP